MAGKVLTVTLLDSIKPPKAGRLELADLKCSGLAFRITAAGSRTWCFRFRDPDNGKTTRATLGDYGDISLAVARERADGLRRQVAGGINPVTQRRALVASAASRTFGALAERYMTEHAQRKKRPTSIRNDRGILGNHILPAWGARAYTSIKRADAVELIEGLITAGKPTMGNRVHALASKVFSFGIAAGLLDSHPLVGMPKRHVEATVDRVLSDDEIRLFWSGIGETRIALALKLALLTGCRRAEVAGINAAECVNLDMPTSAVWVIPGGRVKNKRDHAVPLAPLALATVRAMLEHDDVSHPDAVTGAMRRFGEGAAAAATTWATNPPTVHDLRRTFETRLAALGVAKEHRDRVLNHVGAGGVGDKHYNRYDYIAEKRAALTRWNDALAAILDNQAGAAVIPFSRAIDG